MATPLPARLLDQIAAQDGTLSLRQAFAAGMSRSQLTARLNSGRWRHVLPRVFVTFDGPRRRSTEIWAALLYAGPGATISHQTAAELWGFADQAVEVGTPVDVTVPVDRRVRNQPGVRIHYAQRLSTSRHPTRNPPRTRVEDTVLDLADTERRLGDVVGWVTRACHRRLTTPDRLAESLAARKKIRWRRELHAMLADVADGAETPLELGYLRLVERAHGLPEGHRQLHRHANRRSQWIDVVHEAYALIVELDGRVGHIDDGRFRDHRRDNFSTDAGFRTLRYGWTDIFGDPCAVAAQVARALRASGWSGTVEACARCSTGIDQAA
jgi:hypothetical protein